MFQFRLLFERSYAGNIPKMFLYVFVYNFILFLPIWVIFLQEVRGLSLLEVTITDVAFWATMALSEIPTGVVADTMGRKQSLFIAIILVTLAMILFATAPTFPLIMLANSLWAVALTFDSGANISLFYDSLVQLGREAEYPRLRGRLSMVWSASIAISGALGGLIGEINLAYPFFLTAAITFPLLFLVLRLKEPPMEEDEETGQRLTFRQTLVITAGAVRTRPNLLFALLYSNLIPLAGMIFSVLFIQPYAVSIGIPIAAIGFLTFGLRSVDGVGSALAHRILKFLGEWRVLLVAPLFVLVGMLGLSLVNTIAGILIFVLAGFASAVVRPVVEGLILRNTPRGVRSTILSVDSLLLRAFIVVVEPGLGLIADRRGLPPTFAVMGLGGFALTVVVLAAWGRVRQRAAQPAALDDAVV